MKIKIICVVAVLLLTGCVTKKGPINNSDFELTNTLDDLQGIYRNKGDTGNSDYDIYLSKIIWPSDASLNHEQIDLLQVEAINKISLMVTAIGDGKTVYKAQFYQGKDFSFENGRIILNHEGGVAGFKTGEPLLGLYSGKVILGLDKKDQGKFRSSSRVIGMAYLIVPVAVKAMEDVRFERIKNDSINQLKNNL